MKNLKKVSFFVEGRPVSQGNHRTSASGYSYETTKGHKAWRRLVEMAARQESILHLHHFDGAVNLSAVFLMPRPVAHWSRATGKLKQWAEEMQHTTRPDLSKLVRAVEDSLTGSLLVDDSQIVSLNGTEKKYCGSDGAVGVHITIEEVFD